MILARIETSLAAHQPEEQHGFRKHRRMNEHLLTAMLFLDKAWDKGIPVWIVSLDLAKAFDRGNWNGLWLALHDHGISDHLVWILQLIYSNQLEEVQGEHSNGDPFPIHAGVQKWKAKLFHHGVQLGHGNRLTHIRYADDLMLVATSSKDLIYMLETLIPELAACGLQLNSAKTKILTTSPLNTSEFVDVCGEMVQVIQVIHAESVHKYLGRNLTANFLARRDMEFAHRLQVAWNKFLKYKHVLLNKHISLVLRLKLFDAVVSPAMLFGLATLPLTKVCLQKLGVVQRRMLRSIDGWVRIHDDQNWRDIMAQMNHRMAIANILFPMEDWEARLFRSKFRLAHRIARSPEAWPAKSVSWDPLTN